MIQYSDSAREWMNSLDDKDKQRLAPILEIYGPISVIPPRITTSPIYWC